MTHGVVVTGTGAVRAPALEALPEVVRTRAARAERVTQLLLCAATIALDTAGLAVIDGEPRARLGVVLGTALGCFVTNAAYQRRLADGGPAAASPRLFAATVSNAAAGELAIAYRLGGPAITLSAGTVAGLVAIAHATDLLEAGAADVIVAGGADAVDETVERWVADGGFGGPRAIGEGAAILVLERTAHAAARGARALGAIVSSTVGFGAMREADASLLVRSPGLAAAGPFEALAALDGLAPGTTRTIVDACPTGHHARVVLGGCA